MDSLLVRVNNHLSRTSGQVLFRTLYVYVCLSVSPSLPLVRVGQLLRYADKRIVNITKVYIERNKSQVELI